MSTAIEEIKSLSIDDRMLLIEALWDSINADEFTSEFEFDESLKKELDNRLQRLEKGIIKTYSWHEMKKRIMKRK